MKMTECYTWLWLLCLLGQYIQVASNDVTKRVCQNSVLHLDCEGNQQIVVKTAIFGRTQRFTEECGYQSTSQCSGRETVHIVAGHCALKSHCAVTSSTSQFGNPCPGIWKYLQADYACEPAASIQPMCSISEGIHLKPGDRGYLTSPDYPDTYTDTPTTCQTQLISAFGTSIHLKVFHMNFPDGNTCTRDNLSVMDMETSEVTALCNDFDRPVSMTFRNVTVTFATDEQGDFGVDLDEMAKGFIMEYEVTGCPLSSLTIPDLARLVDFRYGVSAEVMCDEGFRFREGMSGRCECASNKWMCDEPLHCEPIPCDLMDFATPAHAESMVIDGGRTVNFTCEVGFVPDSGDMGQLVCDKGHWTGVIGKCEEAECSLSSLSVPAHMKVALGADGRSAYFRCRYGYKPVGGALNHVTCERGVWTGETGTCEEADLDTSCRCHQVAFSAHLSPAVVMVTANHPIPCDVITLNDGHGYVTSEHLFEAPLGGVYVFTWNVHSVLSNALLSVVKDGEEVGGGWVEGMGGEWGQKEGSAHDGSEHQGMPGRQDGDAEDGGTRLKDSGSGVLLKGRQDGDAQDGGTRHSGSKEDNGVLRMRRSFSGQVILVLKEGDRVWVELRGEGAPQDGVRFVTSQAASLPSVTFTGHLLYAH